MNTTDPEQTELQEIEKQLQALHDRKEILSSAIKARGSADIIRLLKSCDVDVDGNLTIAVKPHGSIEKDFDAALGKSSDGWNHFEISLASQIYLRGDDGHHRIIFVPSIKNDETAKIECDSRYAFERIVQFLKSVGVPMENVLFDSINRYRNEQAKQLAETDLNIDFALRVIQS